MSRRNKIIIAVIVGLLLIALGVFLYFLWSKPAVLPPDDGSFPPPSDEIVPTEEPPTVLPEGKPGAFEPILRQLSKIPIAGAMLGSKGGETIVRYQERSAGNIYEIGAAGEGEKRLTNTTIPKVYEALWSKSGSALISRYVRDGSETIESFSSRINQGTTGAEGELQGAFLQREILEGAISPEGTSFFYLLEENGGVTGIRSDLSGSGKTKLWASPLREWLVSWPSANKIMLLSKPSVLASGMLISLDPIKGGSTLILRDIPGLTALANPVHSEILYSASSEKDFSLYLFDMIKGKHREVSVTTLPEKCVWNKNGDKFYCGVPKTIPVGSYPDVWYQGVNSFEDAVWSSTPSGTLDRILDISDKRGAPIDLVNPILSSDEKFLIFTDKVSSTLWSLQMTE